MYACVFVFVSVWWVCEYVRTCVCVVDVWMHVCLCGVVVCVLVCARVRAAHLLCFEEHGHVLSGDLYSVVEALEDMQ